MALTGGGWPIIGWARSAVAPVGGALSRLAIHDLAAPVLRHLLEQIQLPVDAVDALVLGNALGANGNPARMVALAAGLSTACPAITVDTQCCSGLDAVTQACGMLALGQAQVVIAGGAEAWSRAPLRMHRPWQANEPALPYERPAFAPPPFRDPDMLEAAADTAQRLGISRQRQDAYAIDSHHRAVQATDRVALEIAPVAGLTYDAYPRLMLPQRVARMPAVQQRLDGTGLDCSLSVAGISPKADGAAFIVLATPKACERWHLQPQARWLGAVSQGNAPEEPMLCVIDPVKTLLQRHQLHPTQLSALELHDAFAAQALALCDALDIPTTCLNQQGGGIARGHPIGASGAIALVRALSQIKDKPPQARAVACVAGAGGLGTATLLAPW